MSYETVMGLEVHVQLATRSKLFSKASTAFGSAPNSQASVVDLALPGTLPVLNREAVSLAIRFGLSIGAHIHPESLFARKHYFYPDLPKGYQISQMDDPIVQKGQLSLDVGGQTKVIHIQRAHLEEDAGKSIHDAHPSLTALDFNRAGTPLLEIVTDPDFRSKEEVIAYLKKLHHLVRYLGISDGNMQEGSFRADVNLSLRKKGESQLGTRVELKNLNSFKFIERAIEVETERQTEALFRGEKIVQETRLFDPDADETRSMRTKETAQDYRYFPDPDLLPVLVDSHWIEEERAALPEMPWVRRTRYQEKYGISSDDIDLLMQQPQISDYFEQTLQKTEDPKRTANWIIGEILPRLNEANLSFDQNPLSPQVLADLIQKIQAQVLSSKTAKIAFDHLWQQQGTLDEIIQSKNLAQVSDSKMLESHVEQLFQSFPAQIQELRSGKEKVMGFLLGQIMKATQGKANPEEIQRMIRERLEKN
jgi:aspartyl-tRNA(Asn)/glutamyl-tRNA(Gln) amidotransferase subunit B